MDPATDDNPLRRTDGGIAVALPFDWVADVWARGLALVFGRLCVAAESSDGLRWTLTTVGADLGALDATVVDLDPQLRR